MARAAANPFPAPVKLRRLQIEITTGCNLKCAGCPRTVAMLADEWHNRHMPVQRFRAVIQNAPLADVAVLQGVGEPTIHPKLPQLLDIALESGKFDLVSFNTNALVRDLGYYMRLAQRGLRHLSVSVDALDQEGAAITRAGTDAEKLKKQLSGLLRLFPGLTVSIVLSRMNLDRLEGLLDYLIGIGTKVIEVQPLVSYAASTNALGLNPQDIARGLGIIREARARYGQQSMIVAAPGMEPSGKRCHRPLNAAYCTVEGLLTPCCVTNDTAYFDRTSLEHQSFTSAWQSQGVAQWMEQFRQREPEMCQGCGYNPRGFEAESGAMNEYARSPRDGAQA